MYSILLALLNHAARSNPKAWVDARKAEINALFPGKDGKENESTSKS